MQSKNTLQTFRDLPSYPVIVSRAVAILHLILGLAQGIPGALLVYGGLSVTGNVTSGISLSDENTNSIRIMLLFNGLLLLGLGLASLWVAYGNFTARPSIWVTTIWVTALHVAGWLSGTTQVSSVLLYLVLIFGAVAVVIYLFDPRIKAYFQRGKLAAQYHQWSEAVRLGRSSATTPWE